MSEGAPPHEDGASLFDPLPQYHPIPGTYQPEDNLHGSGAARAKWGSCHLSTVERSRRSFHIDKYNKYACCHGRFGRYDDAAAEPQCGVTRAARAFTMPGKACNDAHDR